MAEDLSKTFGNVANAQTRLCEDNWPSLELVQNILDKIQLGLDERHNQARIKGRAWAHVLPPPPLLGCALI